MRTARTALSLVLLCAAVHRGAPTYFVRTSAVTPRIFTAARTRAHDVVVVGRPPLRGCAACAARGSRTGVVRSCEAADDEARVPHTRRNLLCLFCAMVSLISVEAVVVQALPMLLTDLTTQPGRVAELLSTIAAGSALVEFLLLPAVAALSDTFGRRPLLLVLPALAVALRVMVLLRPSIITLVLSRIIVGALVNYFDLFVGVVAADLFSRDSAALAGVEGYTAAAWGIAYACGVLIGARVLSSGVGAVCGPIGAYACSTALAVLALICALGARETLPEARRVRFSVRQSNPLSCFRLFRSGRVVGILSAILALQALHDGEGDIWQVYGTDMRGWGTRENSLYGAAVGTAITTGGLLTEPSVRLLGNRLHTLLWTLSTAVSSVLSASCSSALAFLSVLFCVAEDSMSAAVVARLVQAGGAAGLTQGQLAGAVHNLQAIVRVVGLYAFGRLYLVGSGVGIPQLPYALTTVTQLAAAALVFCIPAKMWQQSNAQSHRRADDGSGSDSGMVGGAGTASDSSSGLPGSSGSDASRSS